MKYKRQSKILELISRFDIYTQDELADRLGKNGFAATQATISRDIKELKLLKVPAQNGQYKYASANHDEDKANAKFLNILNETVTTIQTAKNLIVVKTYSGMANAAAAAIDDINFPEVIGSIAGDDTIFLAFANDENAEIIAQRLGKMIR
jgi:transcriptional regulator of arginine metabolism